jgi:hypothetical protein
VVHTTREDGVEDTVFFDARPAREELVYELDVSEVPGLRLVGGTLEPLDAGGAPRLSRSPTGVTASAPSAANLWSARS